MHDADHHQPGRRPDGVQKLPVSTQWRLAREAAERYETILVPLILGPFAVALVESANIAAGEAVLDVGCGSGAATRAALPRARRVVGLDPNAGMLEVARSKPGGDAVEWCEGCAERLPFGDESFDVVLCAQTMQFVRDRGAALTEMRRVLRRGGRLALSAWAPLADNPYFEALVGAVERHLGIPVGAGLRAVFALADANDIVLLLQRTGWQEIGIRPVCRVLALPSLARFVPRHLSATPLADAYAAASPAQRAAVVGEVEARLAVAHAGGPMFPFCSHVAMATRAG